MEETLGERLARLRKEHGYSQSQVAERLNVDRASIAKYENDQRGPSFETLVKLARVYHTTTDYLLGITDKTYMDVSELDGDEKAALALIVDRLTKQRQ